MKLKNKKTGEIIDIDLKSIKYPNTSQGIPEYKLHHSLAELNDEWEDYEEPKEYYAIDLQGDIIRWARHSWEEQTINKTKAIGNYFETEEEAEKAVEKLKAFKRLKDNGMIKYSFHKEKTGIDLDFYTLTILAPRDKDSLDLLFGGEE